MQIWYTNKNALIVCRHKALELINMYSRYTKSKVFIIQRGKYFNFSTKEE